jgi:stage IV sporulation protein FB
MTCAAATDSKRVEIVRQDAGQGFGGAGRPATTYLCGLAMLRQGYLRIARPAGLEVRLHWTVALGALLAARFHFEPAGWLGFFAVLLAHSLGHVALLQGVGAKLAGVEVTAIGGQCRIRGGASTLQRSIVAWGGVLGQAVLLGVAFAYSRLRGAPVSQAGLAFQYCLVDINLALIAINLLPFAPLDGAVAWELFADLGASEYGFAATLFGPFRRWARQRRVRRRRASSSAALDLLQAAPEPAALPGPRAIGRGQRFDSEQRQGARADRERDDVVLFPQPSAEAQREIEALLERVQEAAARARRPR